MMAKYTYIIICYQKKHHSNLLSNICYLNWTCFVPTSEMQKSTCLLPHSTGIHQDLQMGIVSVGHILPKGSNKISNADLYPPYNTSSP